MIYLNLIVSTRVAIFVKLSLQTQEQKRITFFFHYGQMGVNRGNGQLPVNILRRGPITYYTISYDQHKNFFDFFGERIVHDFLSSLYNRFNPDKE